MSVDPQEMSERSSVWPRPVVTPKPLVAALTLLKSENCALSHLDLAEADPRGAIGEQLSPQTQETLSFLDEQHRLVSESRLPGSARNAMLQVAHIVDWPEMRTRFVSLEEAVQAFHYWNNVVILCKICHEFYDNAKLIQMKLVQRAREAVLRTETGRHALELFIRRSLAMRSGQDSFCDMSAAYAVFELRKLHGGSELISVKPWPKDRRYLQSNVNPATGQIGVGVPGGNPNEGFFFYAVTDVPPPEPTHPN